MKRKVVDGLSVLENLPARMTSSGSQSQRCIVFVHGAMDKGAGFLPVTRHLPDEYWISYDRRGYGKSTCDPESALSIDAHIDDLCSVIAAIPVPVVVVGHSLGGVLALGAATRTDAVVSVVVFEPPLSWLSWWPRTDPTGVDVIAPTASETVDRFMERVIGVTDWQDMSTSLRQQRYDDGPALLAELTSLRRQAPFDPQKVHQPVTLSRGSTTVDIRLRAVEWLEEQLPVEQLVVIDGAGHLAHRSHPKEFAQMVRTAAKTSSVES
ncbi:MAG: hypothetical protein RLZZ31_72 [Actinomycetota bacterium]